MSSQSSSTDYILLLKSVQKYLYQFGGPVLMGVGGISCILNLVVFSKKNLRKNPCSIYLMAFNIVNFIIIYSVLFSVSLSLGYSISPAVYNLGFCRYNLYMANMLDILSPSYLILASIDRMLITSPNTETRRRSTCRLAYVSVISITLFWILFHSHILFLASIIQVAPNAFVCYFQSGVELVFVSYYTLITKVFLVPLLMITFGLLTVRNIRKVRRVTVAPILTTSGTTTRSHLKSNSSKDRQLFLMLLIDIIVYIIFSFMLSAVHLYEQITQYNVKSPLETQFGLLFRYVSIFINYIPICIGCYTNFFISKTFRNEIKNTLLCK